MISSILACTIREAIYLCFTHRERERERERCAGLERETSRSRGSQLQMHNILIYYKQDTQEARSTRTDGCRGNKHPLVISNHAHNAHLIYEKHFRGPLAFGAQGRRLPLPNGKVCPCVVEREIRIMDVQPTNLQQLRDAIMPIWTKISEGCFQHLVESIPRRNKAVWRQRGVQPGTSNMYIIKWPVSVY